MGSYDGAETCELVGNYILSQLKEIPHEMEIGLYRDDGLAVLNQTPQKIEKIKKEICKVFAKKQPTHHYRSQQKDRKFPWRNTGLNHWEVQALFEANNHSALCPQQI